MPLSLLDGNDDITKKTMFGLVRRCQTARVSDLEFIRFIWERKHVRRRILAAKNLIQFFHPPVRNQGHRKIAAMHLFYCGPHGYEKGHKRSGTDLDLFLKVNDHGRQSFQNYSNEFRTPERSSERVCGGRRLCRKNKQIRLRRCLLVLLRLL